MVNVMPPDLVEEGLGSAVRAELGDHMFDSKIENDNALLYSNLIIIGMQKLIHIMTSPTCTATAAWQSTGAFRCWA